jgi:elongation factor P--(R)-beta-lysine ligase
MANMSLVPKANWAPTATRDALQTRASIIARIRGFFEARDVLAVETPLLCGASVTAPYIDSFVSTYQDKTKYLQTSPEYAMKRLLASGSGDIYQICKAFRDEPSGHQHNPEFTMLEWYRLGFDMCALMDEVANLVCEVLPVTEVAQHSYQDCFEQVLAFNPHHVSAEVLSKLLKAHCGEVTGLEHPDDDTALQLLFTQCVEPWLEALGKPVLVFDYPASQAALAKVLPREDGVPVAKRFELYYQGLELANGFDELTDSTVQRQRFEADNAVRVKQFSAPMLIDEYFLAALEAGLPECSGVAVGVDRLVMLACGAKNIADVSAFTIGYA